MVTTDLKATRHSKSKDDAPVFKEETEIWYKKEFQRMEEEHRQVFRR